MTWADAHLSEEAEERIINMLAEGFGVEDIALDLKLTLPEVRRFVFGMAPAVRREIYRDGAAR